jgi:hypothetical protein
MSHDRRRFLRLLGGTSALAAAGLPRSLSAAEPAHPVAADETWDMSWVDRVRGKFRAVFDSPELSEGAGLFRAIMWCNQYKDVYATARTEMSPVLVIRHAAIPLVMNDDYWKRYKIGKETKMKAMGSKKWIEANPIRVAPPGTPPEWASYNLEQFLSSGGIVLACNLAFGEAVATVRAAEKLDEKAARARAIELLIPGVILQPSGVFAVLRAQEAGCKYILAS